MDILSYENPSLHVVRHAMIKVKRRIWEIVEAAHHDDRASQVFDIFILTLIITNVLASVVSTVVSIKEQMPGFFAQFEFFSVMIFSIEYFLRIWTCSIDPRFSNGWRGRLKFMVSPLALIDLLAITPFYLPFLMTDLRAIRVLRLFRIFRLAKIVRYSKTLQILGSVLKSKKEELVLVFVVMSFMIILSASVMFYVEHPAQPELFKDIPTTMWWAIVTLTTVGYGDIYPITNGGRMIAAAIAIMGIVMFALPTGIIGAGFVEHMEELRDLKKAMHCPHCGKEIKRYRKHFLYR